MTQEERIAICKNCTNRRISVQEGLLCNLTSQPPAFEESCPDYHEQMVQQYADTPQSVESISELSQQDVEYFKLEQNFPMAVVAGILSCIAGAVLWAILTVATGYQIGFMALGVGALVGFAIQYAGKGVEQKFGYLGGLLAFIGCALGNIFGMIAISADYAGVSYLDIVNMIPLSTLMDAMLETFGIMDIVFYGIAIVEGYKFSFRKISAYEIQKARS